MKEKEKSILSLELASAIFGEKISYVDDTIVVKKTGRYVRIIGETFDDSFEVSFIALNKCKSWVNLNFGKDFDKGYVINSRQDWIVGVTCGHASVLNISNENIFEAPTCFTEEEAIVYACEFILKLEGKK